MWADPPHKMFGHVTEIHPGIKMLKSTLNTGYTGIPFTLR